MKRKREKSGLTLVELLTVLAIISLLVGLLIPAVTAVKRSAMEAKQKGQFLAIDMGLTTFKGDYDAYGGGGGYPPSAWTPAAIYCGAQKLSEALLGWDLLGFHPKSEWTPTGRDATGTVLIYNPADLSARKGSYLELGTTSAFRLNELYDCSWLPTAVGTDRYVLCDVFGATKVTLPGGKQVKAGAPILYYRADTSGKTIDEIYNVTDNDIFVDIKERADHKPHPLHTPSPPFGTRDAFFYGIAGPTGALVTPGYITDPKITAKVWPYRPGSYILISAGADGIYGTPDDIHNFGD